MFRYPNIMLKCNQIWHFSDILKPYDTNLQCLGERLKLSCFVLSIRVELARQPFFRALLVQQK